MKPKVKFIIYEQPLVRDRQQLEDIQLLEAAPEMLEELEFLITHCIEVEEREYANGETYEIECIKAYPDAVKRIRELIAKAKGGI